VSEAPDIYFQILDGQRRRSEVGYEGSMIRENS